MRPEFIRKEFSALCEAYAKTTKANYTELDVQKKTAVFGLLYNFMKVELVYVEKGNTFVPTSTLYCRIYPYKNRSISITMPSVFPYAGVSEFRACVFPYIENKARLKACFDALTGILDDHMAEFEDAFADPAAAAVKEWLTREVGAEDPDALIAGDETAENAYMFTRNLFEKVTLAKYTVCDGYYFFLDGNIKRSLKYYRKEAEKGRISAFEESLLRFLESPESDGFIPITEECFSWKASRPYVSGKTTGLILLKSMLLVYGISTVVCCLIVGIIGAVLAKDTVFYFGAPWYCGFICAGLPGIFGGLALFRKLTPIVHKKNVAEQLEFDDITNSPGVYKFANAVFAVAILIGLAFSVSISLMPLRLYETYGDCYASDILIPEKTVFEYEDIDRIYYIEGRYNPYGDFIDRPSYVIRLTDGTAIDFDAYTSVKRTEKEALPFFEEMGIEIVRVDSDRDVPGMTEYLNG